MTNSTNIAPELVAPTSYRADRAEILRELARLVSEQGLPAPITYQAAGTVSLQLESAAHVDSWAAHQALSPAQFRPQVHVGAHGRWRSYEAASEFHGWLGWTFEVWARVPAVQS